jgi:outer membrane murein-binding lipoprotein Lpp
MTISKSQFTTEGDNLRLSMPFSKVDKERRIVSGFATLDNVDRQDDIVTTDASLKAFAKFRGNIREMHQPLAVGKMIAFKEDKYFDPDSKKFYSGVYVSAYVSKGAQDTWEKVLDGTLSGFSIGGRMNDWDDAYDEKMDKSIRVIKEYDLVELSLVDTPANQFANIMSIEKVDGVDVVKGDVADIEIENVFWDEESGMVLITQDDSASSPINGNAMKNIGFVEKNDNEKSEMIKFLVDSAKGIDLSKMNKEVSPMTEENTTPADEAVVEKSDEVAPEADAVVETVEKADEAEVAKTDDMDEDDMEEKSDDMEDEETMKSDDMEEEDDKSYDKEKSDSVEASVETTEEVSKSDDVTDAVSELKDGITSAFSDLSAVVKSLNEQIADLKKSLDGANAEIKAVKDEVTAAKSGLDEFGKRVDAVETDTAFRKSGDLGEIVQYQPEQVEKSIWGGRFLKTADLFS